MLNVAVDVAVDEEELTESVEELKAKLETMKRLMKEQGERGGKGNRNYTARRDTIIDGTFLSAVFAVVFILIVGVSFYAFRNLYYAILKKFPSKHTEL
jgi:hypothetical protein